MPVLAPISHLGYAALSYDPLDLSSEDGLSLLTESGDNLVAENSLSLFDPQPLSPALSYAPKA